MARTLNLIRNSPALTIAPATERTSVRRVVGHAAVFSRLSQNLGTVQRPFYETLSPGCFAEVLRATPDVRALVDHNESLLLGRTKAGTLKLFEDRVGLAFSVELPDTTYARDLMVSMARGDKTQCSFAFTVGQDRVRRDGNAIYRDVLSVGSLLDISMVTFPAYVAADAALRVHLQTRGVDLTGVIDVGFKLDAGDAVDDSDISVLEDAIAQLEQLISEADQGQSDTQSNSKRRRRLRSERRGLDLSAVDAVAAKIDAGEPVDDNDIADLEDAIAGIEDMINQIQDATANDTQQNSKKSANTHRVRLDHQRRLLQLAQL